MDNVLFPRVPSGIPGLNDIIGGGFTKNNLIALSGSTGSGRTIFSTQFLVNGHRQNKEPGLYITFDEPKFSIFANMLGFKWDLPKMEREKQVVFIEYPQNELSGFLEQEGSILELIDTLGVERVVFDSITPLAMHAPADERRMHLQKIVNTIRKWGATTLITAEDMVPPDPNIPRTSYGIENMTDGYIHLGWMREGTKRMRTLDVVKLRGTPHQQDVHPCIIDEEGFKVGVKKKKKGK
ncbi:MAG: ATPase domain-containing protein [Candidatus Micrarchaeota archaeon]